MRLIDADKLKEATCYNCHEDGYELGDKYCRWEDVCFNLAMIKDAPTVEAIPIEWIESQVDKGKWAELVQRWAERKEE